MEVTIQTEDGEVTESGVVRVDRGFLGGISLLQSVPDSNDLEEIMEGTESQYYPHGNIVNVSEE